MTFRTAPRGRPSDLPSLQFLLALAASSACIVAAGPIWLTLHRSLHRVHHAHPGLAWTEAPQRLKHGPPPAAYAAFVRRWWKGGPRQWPATGAAAAGTRP